MTKGDILKQDLKMALRAAANGAYTTAYNLIDSCYENCSSPAETSVINDAKTYIQRRQTEKRGK